jgi:hypothetical protein
MKIVSSLAVVSFLVVAACGKSETEPKTVANAERPTCKSAADCTMTTFSGCCSCCEAAPKAMLKTELDRQQGRCHGAVCAPCKEDLECVKNERLDSFDAVCSKEGTCVSEKKKTP